MDQNQLVAEYAQLIETEASDMAGPLMDVAAQGYRLRITGCALRSAARYATQHDQEPRAEVFDHLSELVGVAKRAAAAIRQAHVESTRLDSMLTRMGAPAVTAESILRQQGSDQ